MAFSTNPKFVTDGLGLALDANDINSQRTLREVEVMVVGGGGGGGMDMGGGGGGGGVVYQPNYQVTSGVGITVTVGAGGFGAPAAGTNRTDGVGPQPGGHQYTVSATNGGDSAFGTLVAKGGGYGASSYYGYTPNQGYGGTGASGGGCSAYTHGGERYVDNNNIVGQGYPGGNSGNPASGADDHYSGGGGGAGGRGTSGPNHVAPSGTRGDGGPGVIIPRMSPYYYAGGGGGAGYSANGGYGGLGGGGGGAANNGVFGYGDTNGRNAGGNGGNGGNQPGGNGGANTGGGGGGGSHYNSNNKGGEGGSGIVIIRYNGPQAATGGTYSFENGVSFHTFTSSGTFTPYSADGTGTTWYDTSGNGLNAATAKFYTAHGGRDQKALRSDANNVDTPSTSLLNTDFHSIFMIIRFISTGSYPNATTGGWEQFLGFYGGGSDRTPGVWRYPSNRIIHWRYDPGNSGCDFLDYYGTGGDFALNRDYFIGVTKNGPTGTPYVDGVAVPIYSGGAVSNPKTAGSSVIRMFDYYTSEIMEIKGLWIYNRVLTAAEVLQNYNSIRSRLIK